MAGMKNILSCDHCSHVVFPQNLLVVANPASLAEDVELAVGIEEESVLTFFGFHAGGPEDVVDAVADDELAVVFEAEVAIGALAGGVGTPDGFHSVGNDELAIGLERKLEIAIGEVLAGGEDFAAVEDVVGEGKGEGWEEEKEEEIGD